MSADDVTTLGGLARLLRELLLTHPEDTPVILSQDAAGDTYSPLADYSTGRYEPDSTWAGDFTSEGSFEDGPPEEYGNPAICLWPTH